MTQEVLPFHGRIKGEQTTDRSEWPAMVKAAGKLERTDVYYGEDLDGHELNPRSAMIGYQSDHGGRAVLTSPMRVRPTKDEHEWLGVDVLFRGEVWQVWALHPLRDRVWLVRGGEFDSERISALRRA